MYVLKHTEATDCYSGFANNSLWYTTISSWFEKFDIFSSWSTQM